MARKKAEKIEGNRVEEKKIGGKGENGNLISLDQRTKTEQRAIQSAGGKASVAARRKRKEMRQFLQDFLDADAAPALKMNMAKLGLNEEDMSNYAALCLSLFSKAINHADINAFRTIMEYAGRAPLQEMRENEAVARMSQVIQLAGGSEKEDDGITDVVFYIPDNGRPIVREDELVTVEDE